MANTMNDATRTRVVDIAKQHGFQLRPKQGGADRYVKNLMFRHAGVGQTVYVRKDTGMNTSGNASSFTVAIHPDYYRPAYDNPALGIVRKRNGTTGNYRRNLVRSAPVGHERRAP